MKVPRVRSSFFDKPASPAPAVRSLEAAGGGRRWTGAPAMTDPAGDFRISAATVSARAHHFVANTATGTRSADSLTGNLIGTGIVPRPQHPSESIRGRLASAWTAVWCDEADAEGRMDFYGLSAALVRDMIVSGEGLALIEINPATGAPALRRLNPEQLARDETRTLSGGGSIVQGVEFSPMGRIIAYHIRRAGTAADALAGLALKPVRVPASEVIHLFRPLVPGQVRGISWFAPVLLTARELDLFLDAVLMRAKVAALHAGFVVDADGVPPYDGSQTGSTFDAAMEPGALIPLPPGKSIEFSDAPDQGPVGEIATGFFRMIAAGLGVTYAQATGDFSKANYSSERAAQMEFRRFAETIQHTVIVFQLCRPVWARFVRWCVLSGRLPATAYQANPDAFLAVKWLPPGWGWVDPLNDTQAAVLAMQHGLRSRSEIVASLGYDIEALDREIAADTERANRLGLTLGEKTNA